MCQIFVPAARRAPAGARRELQNTVAGYTIYCGYILQTDYAALNKKNFIKFYKKRLHFILLFGILLKRYGSLAQLGEQLPYKQWVTGSSPVAPTIKIVRMNIYAGMAQW